VTLSEVLTRRGIRFRQSAGDRNKLHVNCCFCQSQGKPADTKQRLCIHSKDGWGKCVSCGWKNRYAIAPVLKQLGIVADVEGAERVHESKQELVTLPEDFQLLTKVFDDLDRTAKQYILKRGITEEQIKENKIGVSYTGRYAYRIIFPIYVDKKLQGINARTFMDRAPKYLMSRGEKYIYRFDPNAVTCIFSEGVIKALRIDRVTEFGSSALLGHDLTSKQLEQIQNSSCKHVILYPDPDKVGKQGVIKIADKLKENCKVKISVVWPIPGPADEIPLKDLQAVLTQNLIPFTWRNRHKIQL
jgi:Toprim domain-containing protein